MFDESAHWTKWSTCRCHDNHQYVVCVDVLFCEELIFLVVKINTSDQVKSKFGPARRDLRTAKVVARAWPPHSSAISTPGPMAWSRL